MILSIKHIIKINTHSQILTSFDKFSYLQTALYENISSLLLLMLFTLVNSLLNIEIIPIAIVPHLPLSVV